MTTSERWTQAIRLACDEPDPAQCNENITRLHYALSNALADALGPDGGPNFHTWAVWGSRKAGATIRQEDLDSAIRNATATAGIAGGAIGLLLGGLFGRPLHFRSNLAAISAGSGLGVLVGAWTGRQLAIWSRERAAELVLEGNRTVLRDIGEQTARFLEMLEQGPSDQRREIFFARVRPGRSEDHGQDRLAKAFRSYLAALNTEDLNAKQEATIAANCEIVYHEHIRLQPFIQGAMPFIIQRCATERMMTYQIGEHTLRVSDDLPGCGELTAAKNWTRIEDRMRYVFALFREFHRAPEVFAAPWFDPLP